MIEDKKVMDSGLVRTQTITAALRKALVIKYAVVILAMAAVFWLVAIEFKVKGSFFRVAIYFTSAFLLLLVGNRMDTVLGIPELSRELEKYNQEVKQKGESSNEKQQGK